MIKLLALFFYIITQTALAQTFPITGRLHGLTSQEVPTLESESGKTLLHTLTYLKTTDGVGVYICPFITDRSYQSILSIAGSAILSGKEVFISTVRTDYQGRALTAQRFGTEMQQCANSISFYNVGLVGEQGK